MNHDFSPIQKSLENVLKKYNLQETYEVHRLFNEWNLFVGEKLSAVSLPVSYKDKEKILIIKLHSEAWKEEFIKQKHHLLSIINRHLKTAKLEDLIFE